ncbi:MAG TPA: glycosyltransferase [Candidatus Polarisedimenticolaceae bacterium]|nr:glycosyltransferase [Candidatus Polarisedimenticolaceae bacterium]
MFQRPQHLMTRWARRHPVLYVEEPVAAELPSWRVVEREEGVRVAIPQLPQGTDAGTRAVLLDALLRSEGMTSYALWYYTPMALPFSRHLKPEVVIYDCMDELSAFAFAPPELRGLEDELFRRADVVFTGGVSLYEAKRDLHANVHAVPSSIDAAHFGLARALRDDPPDQVDIPGPRLGFFGVLDERLDIALLDAVACLRPDWSFVMIGPVVKIDPARLPRRPNLHYLGARPYTALPRYLAGWDVALLPFARNDATRHISPTKTPEYLAAGRRVVSTSIRDVVRPYGEKGLVEIADTPEAFEAACARALAAGEDETTAWLAEVDALLARTSWDRTFGFVRHQVTEARAARRAASARTATRRPVALGGPPACTTT